MEDWFLGSQSKRSFVEISLIVQILPSPSSEFPQQAKGKTPRENQPPVASPQKLALERGSASFVVSPHISFREQL